jgi:hypothetical protein
MAGHSATPTFDARDENSNTDAASMLSGGC